MISKRFRTHQSLINLLAVMHAMWIYGNVFNSEQLFVTATRAARRVWL